MIERIEGIDVEFIKGHTPETTPEQWTYGWKANIGGHQYGDYVVLSDPAMFDEAHDTLLEQARQVIKAKKP